MADIYEAYQEYLNNIGEYVPSASDVYGGIAGLTSRVPEVARDVLLPSDNGDGGTGGGAGGGGTGGIGDLVDKYNDLGFIGRGAVNTGIGLAFPQAAGLLGLYNVGKGIYDFGSGVLGYNEKPTPTMNYDFYGDLDGAADPSTGSYSTNPGIGFSNIDPEDVQQFSQAEIDSMNQTSAAGVSSGGVDATNAAEAEAAQGGYGAVDSGDYE
jgi:hypothetical protein